MRINKIHFLCAIMLSVIVLLTALSCEKDVEPEFEEYSTDFENFIEVPKLDKHNIFLPHYTIIGDEPIMTYCVEYDTVRNHSHWVAFRFDGVTSPTKVGRSKVWYDDPDLPSKYRVGAGTYSGGRVRGHLCASYDRRYTVEAEEQTFYMTNMSPMGYDFNGDYWTKYESFVQERGRKSSFANILYVVKGGTLDQTKGSIYSSDGKKIPIPKYYFIALLAQKGINYKAMGFWVEHNDYGKGVGPTSEQMRASAMSIDELEKKTGIDFFHNLADNIENEVEANFNYDDWF